MLSTSRVNGVNGDSGYVDKVTQFDGATYGNVTIRAGETKVRKLELIVPSKGTKEQAQAFLDSVEYGREQGVLVDIIVAP
jgi:hypothetical protein